MERKYKKKRYIYKKILAKELTYRETYIQKKKINILYKLCRCSGLFFYSLST